MLYTVLNAWSIWYGGKRKNTNKMIWFLEGKEDGIKNWSYASRLLLELGDAMDRRPEVQRHKRETEFKPLHIIRPITYALKCIQGW